jgi:hypothetical protein
MNQRPSALAGARAPNGQQPNMGRGTAAAVGVHQGARSSLPIAGGIVGGVLGSGLGPLGTVAGVGLGAGIGETLGQAYDAFSDVPTVDELPQELRPWGVAGEVLGGSAVPGMGPLAVSGRLLGEGRVPRFINRVLDSAQQYSGPRAVPEGAGLIQRGLAKRPGAYAVAETAAAAGAASGAGVASELYEGNVGAELAGGVVGGVAGPGSAALALTSLADDGIKRVRQWASTAGRESRAAQELKALLDETGEDPKMLAASLRSLPSLFPGDTRTSAQMTGSPALQMMEAELSRRNSTFGRDAARKGAESLEIMRGLIGRLSATGDPAALREASQLRQRYFEGLIGARLEAAEKEAADAAAKITSDTPAARAELSRRSEEILTGALSNARAAERELWGKIPGHVPSTRKALLAEATRIAKEELLPSQKLPLDGAQQAFVQGRGRSPTVRQMLTFRSQMLDEARKASAASDQHSARIYGHLAEAALEDLSGTMGTDEAREFSRTLNDVFTRSFVGDALATEGSGASRIPPEVLMRRALAGPAEAVDLRMQELERAVRMGSPGAADEMLQIQERLLKLTASEIVDPSTGLANGPRLNRYIRSNEALLNRFPEVRELLQSADSANQWLKATRESTKQATTSIAREAAFAKVAQSENPIQAVAQILRGRAPAQQFRQLATLAHGHGDAAVAGMRSAVLQDAYERAGGTQGQFSFTTLRSALLDPPRPGQPSALQLMRANGVMDADTASRLTRILDEADKVEAAMRTRPQLESLLGDETMLFDAVVSMAGSRLATAAGSVTGNTGGHSIIIAGRGAQFMRDKLAKLKGRSLDVLVAAAENPSFMATLLERAKTPQDKIRIARKANAWFQALGLYGLGPSGAGIIGEQQ